MVRPPRDRRRRTRRLGALLAGALALVLGCSKRDLPTAPANDRPPLLLAFLSERPPSPAFSSDIYFYDLRSGGPAYLPPNLNTASLEGPCNLSADGKHLAFYTNRFPIGSSALLLLYDVTTGLTTVPRWTNTLLSPQNPALSGEGRYLAVQYSPSVSFELYVAVEDLQGDSLLPVPNLNTPGGLMFDPILSADGQLLAASSTRAGTLGGFDIFLYSVPADSFLPLPGLNSTASDLAPSLSADGRYLAFQSGRAGGAGLIDVYVYDRQAGALIPLPGANTAMADYVPSISPDGRYLAYATESSGGRDVRVYDIHAQRLLDLPELNHSYFYDYFPSFASR